MLKMSTERLQYSYEYHVNSGYRDHEFLQFIKEVDNYLIGFQVSYNLIYNKYLKLNSGASSHCGKITSVSWHFRTPTIYNAVHSYPFWIMVENVEKKLRIRITSDESRFSSFKKSFEYSKNIMEFLNFDMERNKSLSLSRYYNRKKGERTLVFILENIDQLDMFMNEAINLYIDNNEETM